MFWEVFHATVNEQHTGGQKICFLEDASSGVNTQEPARLDPCPKFYKYALFVPQPLQGETRTRDHK